ncbi:MucBP domain-containing protein [Ligilactobacillus agilis]|uniref:MucBP domain-containing protein n=1 Tax=Ligilactobacillus agilis TaxID=1601 RepID=A0A9Q9MVP8_9LACO|nr:MucBP domain-containing protein [Ligilactobacillus agilis]UXC63994.1 MucBP domain-containing protein [Ligilactobacillus agilis]UXC65993.1 MucBP domain-containing protein [Ligilactobacillus agilis]
MESMFRDKSNKDLKFAIRKKKNGGGAASFIIGSVVLGGLMVSGITNASADTTTTPDSTSASTTSAASSSATDKNEVTLNSTATPATASSEETSAAETTTAAPASEVTPDSSVATTATDTSASSATATSEEAPVEEGKVVVKYVDESGNQVGMPKLLAGNVGESYDTTAVELPSGYALAGSTSVENATGTYTKDPITVTYTVKKISNTEAATQALDRVAAVSADQLATNKVSISNVHFNKSVVKESQGLDIDYAYDWTGKGLVKGDTLVSEMPAAFTSITKLVETPFYSGNDEIGVLVLDYTNHKIYTRFTGEMDPNKIYNGSINIATFVDRNHFKEVENDEMVQLQMPDGTTVERPLHVTFDAAVNSPQLTLVSVYANESKDNPDKSMDVKWATTINKAGIDLNEAVVYLSPDTVLGINPEFTKKVYDREGNLIGDPSSSYKAINPEYDGNALYKINKDSIEVYEANIHDSMGYEVTKKLVAGTDYKLVEDSSSPNAYVIEFIGDYVKTNKSFVITYDGRVADSSSDRVAINQAVTDSLLAYYEGPYNKYTKMYDAPFNATWNEAAITVNNSSVKGGAQDITGSVTVVHIDASTGKVLKTEDYAKTTDGQVAHDAKQGTGYVTAPEEFAGYKYTTMGYQSAPAEGIVKQGIQRVVYLYVPADKKGSVDVVHKTTDGQILADVKPVVTDVNVGTAYDTEKGNFNGYHFVGMAEDSAAADGVVSEGIKHVIYLYEKDVTPEVKKGNVDVTYVAEDGTVLEATSDVVKDGEIGSNYETSEKTFDGYHFVRMGEFSADKTGQVEEGTKHVVYVYAKDPEEKKGSVDVKYITTDGKVLEDVASVKDNAPVGEDYTTEEKSFDGYHFIGMDKTSDPATGVVAEGTKHVIYVYEKDVTPEVKKGNVDVTYVAEDGKVLEATSDVVKDGEIGSNYETTEKSFEGYHFVRMGEFSADKTGQVEEGTKHVVYVYAKDPEEKKGSVDVKYITTDGKVLEDVASVKDNAPVGEDYTTEEKSFDGYHFIGMDKTSDPATGVVAEGTKHVIYVYEKDVTPEVKKGNVDVTYVAEDGTVLEATSDVVKDGEIGSNYETTEKSFEGYHFVRMGEFSADKTGQVEEGTKHVIYVYAKDPEEKKGSVDVKYITTDGKVLEDVSSVKDNAPVGEDYTTEEKSFDGYHFVGMDKTSDPATGVVAEGIKHVIYVYEKDVTPEVKKGNVDVTYLAEDGTVLEATSDVVKDGEIGSNYETTQKSFDGYHFVRMGEFSADATGNVEEGTKHVVYVYAKNPETPAEKKGNVDVKYITKDGKVLEDVASVKDNAPVGEDYTTEEKSFDGYHFVGMDKSSDPATGVVAEGTKHVIYVYEKDVTPEVKNGNVDVTYVAEDGKVLEATSDVVKDGEIGSNYETTEKSFDGYHFVRMGEFSADATGNVEEGTKHVVYVYAKNPETPVEKKGSVDVKYITKDGEVLEDVTSVKDNAPVGEDYTTEEKSFDGYHFVGMDKSSDPATGLVAEGTKHVIYVYEKDVTPEVKKGNVDVTYLAEDGTVLEATSDVVKDGEVGSNYATEEKSFEGYHFVRMGEFSADATGKVEEGTKHVVYVYAKNPVTPEVKKGSVDVKYITKDGEVLEDVSSIKDNAPIGEDYTTEEKSFDGYHFVGMDKTSDPATGVVAEGTKHVIYVYEKDVTPEVKKGNVDVKYITKDGEVLEDVASVKDNAPVGEDYTTEEKSFDGYHFVGMDKTSDPATGLVAEGTKHVIYVYEKDVTPEVKKGNVDVTYVAEDGKVLETTSDVVKDGEIGSNYETTQKSFDGYHFVRMGEFSADKTGQVAEGTKHVVYVYAKNPETPEVEKGSVDVVYVDEQGNVLPGGELASIKKDAPVGESYTTDQKTFEGYTFNRMGTGSADAEGKVTEGVQHVVYVYTKNPEVTRGTVTVTYVDKNGNPLPGGEKTTVKNDVPVREDYTTEEKTFDGYHFVGMDKNSNPFEGKVTEGTKNVIYVYEKDPVKKGSVDVKYVTVDGEVLSDTTPVVTDVEVGTDYSTLQLDFNGYKFVKMAEGSAQANGQVVEGNQHVVYVYTRLINTLPSKDEETPTPTEAKKGSVDVKYVTTDGTVLQDVTSVKENAEVGTNYETTALEFAGYKLVGVAKDSDSTSGQVTEGAKHVVYVYEKVTPVLTDKHEDKETPSTSTQTEQKPVKEAPATPVAAKLVTKKQVASKQADTNKQALPQTGETQSETNATVLGALALGLAGIFGLGAKKKEDRD